MHSKFKIVILVIIEFNRKIHKIHVQHLKSMLRINNRRKSISQKNSINSTKEFKKLTLKSYALWKGQSQSHTDKKIHSPKYS